MTAVHLACPYTWLVSVGEEAPQKCADLYWIHAEGRS